MPNGYLLTTSIVTQVINMTLSIPFFFFIRNQNFIKKRKAQLKYTEKMIR